MNIATSTGRRLGMRMILALVLVPLLVAGSVLAGLWGFNGNLRRVQAAVVNHDEMVELKGQKVPLGRQLSAALVDSKREQNFTWVLADDANAKAGLASGAYAAVVTIPKEFSASATSYAGDAAQAKQATITIQTSPVAGIAEAALGQSVADAAAQSLNNELTAMYLDNVYLGMNDMGKSFVTVADGARQLADGSAKLTDGLGQASTGAGKLADGLGQASSGGKQLASGVDQYSAGVDQYVDGVNTLVNPVIDVVKQLPDLSALFAQIDTLMVDLPAKAAATDAQIQQAAALIKELLADADKLKAALNQFLGQVDKATSTVSKVASGATTVPCPDDLKATPGACEAFARGVKSGGATAQQALESIDTASIEQVVAGIQANSKQILDALEKVTKASAWFKANAADLQAQWTSIRKAMPAGTTPNQYLVDQLTRLRDGGLALKSGGHQLSSGAATLSSGISQAHDGSVALASGISDAAAGSQKLTDGLDKLADGLADGAKQIPNYSESDRTLLAKVVAAPVSTEGLTGLVTPLIAAAALLLLLALWVGSLATYALVKPVDPRTAASSSTTAHLVWKALLPGVLVASAQAVLLGVLGAAYLGLSVGTGTALVAVLLVAGLAFAVVNHALAAWAGVWGRLASGVMLLVTGVSALTYSAPGIFATLRPLSAASPGLDAVHAVVTGQSPAVALVTLTGWFSVGLIASAYRIARARLVSVKSLVLAA